LDRFAIDQVFGMHNNPWLSGRPPFAIRFRSDHGGLTDAIDIEIEGAGRACGAPPHKCLDSVMVGAQLITALQQIVSPQCRSLGLGRDLRSANSTPAMRAT